MLWSPDTCVCIVDYDVSNETIISVIRHCPEHTFLRDDVLLIALLDESRRKNGVFAQALAIVPGLIEEDYIWSYTINRILQVQMVGFNVSRRNQLQTAVDTSYGMGKVLVLA